MKPGAAHRLSTRAGPGQAGRGQASVLLPSSPSPRGQAWPGTRTCRPTPEAPGPGSRSQGGCPGPARPSCPRPAAAASHFLPAPRVRYLLGAGGCSMAAGG